MRTPNILFYANMVNTTQEGIWGTERNVYESVG